jgi:hypothetical protein
MKHKYKKMKKGILTELLSDCVLESTPTELNTIVDFWNDLTSIETKLLQPGEERHLIIDGIEFAIRRIQP